MSKIWFTADNHFGHSNIIKYCKRPFDNVEQMDKTMIDRWNKLVRPEDIVYHLGDFSFRSKSPNFYWEKLNGNIYLVWGNHDKKSQYDSVFQGQTPLTTIKVKDISITLCHYAMRVWNKSHFNMWHLYGHSHGMLPGIGKSLDVGVDNHEFRPWSWEEIVDYMDKQPNNFNWVGNLPGFNQKEFNEEKKKYEVQKV